MGAVVDFNKMKIEKESWFGRVKDKVVYKAKQLYWWAHDNPGEAAIAASVITAAISGSVKIVKGAIRTRNINQETYNKERYVYDHSLGTYLKVNRRLNNNDIIEINRRMAEGKRKSEVLSEMGLLE